MINVDELRNKKQLGERIAIGELSKYGLDILLPMSDHLILLYIIITSFTELR